MKYWTFKERTEKTYLSIIKILIITSMMIIKAAVSISMLVAIGVVMVSVVVVILMMVELGLSRPKDSINFGVQKNFSVRTQIFGNGMR